MFQLQTGIFLGGKWVCTSVKSIAYKKGTAEGEKEPKEEKR